MKRILILLSALFTSQLATSQGLFYTEYRWERVPSIHLLDGDDVKYPAVIFRKLYVAELSVDAYNANTYTTEHQIIHVNNDAGVEQYNKVRIPVRSSQELIDLHVRAIAPDGKITEFRRENLKELQNVKGYANFKIFAIEGVTVGGEVEYYYTLKSTPQSYGRLIAQDDVPVKDFEFRLVYPKRFGWQVRSYNGLPTGKEGNFGDSKKSISITSPLIPALQDEEYSAYKANLQRVEFKLESNGTTSNMMTWEDVSNNIIHSLYDWKAANKVAKLLKPLKLEELSETDKIIGLENYIKNNFTVQEGSNESYEDVREIIDSHVANEDGIMKLYFACLQNLGIKNQIVLASEREDGEFENDYVSIYRIRGVFFYFPQLSKFLIPADASMRLGAVPDNVANGIFIAYAVKDGSTRYQVHTLKPLPPLDYTHNKLGTKATISFASSMETPEVQQENFFQGYRAFQMRGFYAQVQKEKRDDFLKGITLSGMEHVDVIKREIAGEKTDLSADPDSYFTIKTNYKAPDLIEKTDKDYLVSIGKLIGKQSELYQETERKMDISFQSISDYHHELRMPIPEGYVCEGLEAARIDHQVVVDDQVVMAFKSDYEIKGNEVIIRVNEVYKVLYLPKSKYTEFRAVINSAADFNKLVLILRPR